MRTIARNLNGSVKPWHLFLLMLVIMLSSGGVVLAQDGGPFKPGDQPLDPQAANALFPKGSIGMGAASALNELAIGAGDTIVLTATFKVPAEKKADIVAFFNAEAWWNAGIGYCYGEFRLDSAAGPILSPGELWLADGYVYGPDHYPTLSLQGFKTNVPAGNHTLYVTMNGSGGRCTVMNRSLIVLANVHN